MDKWFLGSLKYEKVMENGKEKKVTEKYLIDALSVTEAEARLIEEMSPFISGDFSIKAVVDTKYAEVVPSDNEADDTWFKCKLRYITLDEKTGAEKTTTTNMLVQAADLRQAVKNLDEHMKGTIADYRIESVSDSKIMDVYPYNSK
jgi:hypothetical protein